jgi:hypothetical protein
MTAPHGFSAEQNTSSSSVDPAQTLFAEVVRVNLLASILEIVDFDSRIDVVVVL